MLHQIEKLQKIVNRLLGLCREAGAEAVIDEIPNDFSHRKYEKLGVFILKTQDGVLSKHSTKVMHKWLAQDKEARRYYIEFIDLTVMLQLYFHSNKFSTSLTPECCI